MNTGLTGDDLKSLAPAGNESLVKTGIIRRGHENRKRMKYTNTISSIGLASITAIVMSMASANAATVANPVNNDIFVAFRASGGTGATTSYIVNLGQYSQFRDASLGSTTALTLGNIGADLTAAFGESWSTRSDLHWGIFGVSNSASPILYASRDAANGGAWGALDINGRGTTASSIVSVLQGTNGYQGREATLNSPVAVFQPNSDLASSYAKQVATPGTNDFGSLSEWSSIEGNFGDGVGGTNLNLYRIAGSGVTTPGHFSIDGSGAISFHAIPEPSVALLGISGAFLWVGARRRKTSAN